jgi:serine/threonine-protein kinase
MSSLPASGLASALADRYRIERELGAGGMATVYLAEDLKHHRKVAVKVLRSEIAASLGADRFSREIQVAAQLQHPHILPLLDSGEAGSFLYYVMPFIDGESLRERLTRVGELPVHDAIRILVEVVDALANAHDHGVVHRDIKPDNIMLSGRHALVMDFGVAKAVSEATGRNQLTTAGVALGTPAYMAPEQAAADPHLDHRVDIYAIGVLGYELLTGRPPFTGRSPQEVLAAHVTQAPDPVERYRPGLSPALSQLLMRCLAKRPADRWQSAEELLNQLEPLATPSGGMTPTQTRPVPAVRPRRVVTVLLPAAALLLAVLGYAGYRLAAGSEGNALQSIAVLPFETTGGDSSQSFADGIQDEILTGLTRISSLRVTSRSSVREYRNSTKRVRQIGEELGVRTLLSGQVQRVGERVRINVQLIDASKDRQLWAQSYDRALSAENVFAIQGDIARNVADELTAQLTPADAAALDQAPTTNLQALEWYHRGRALFDVRGGNTGDSMVIQAFEQAVALDSTFAEAWAGLTAARSWEIRSGVTDDTTAARSALDHAVALKPGTPDTRLAKAFYAYYARGDYESALREFRAVEGSRPGEVDAIVGAGLILRRQGHFAQALEAEQRATVLDPRRPGRLLDLGDTYRMVRRPSEATAMFERARILDPNSSGAFLHLAWVAAWENGDTAQVRGILATAPAVIDPGYREYFLAVLNRLTRHYEASDSAINNVPMRRPADSLTRLILLALNSQAAGQRSRTVRMADSLRALTTRLLGETSAGDLFGKLADVHSALGIAEALLGHAEPAVAEGEHAVRLNPVARDAVEGSRSVDGLLTIHIILGHRDQAFALLREQAARAPASLSLIPTTRAALRLDPLFDSLRDDPRYQALLKDDAAWVVKE